MSSLKDEKWSDHDIMDFGLWLGEQYRKRKWYQKPKTIDELFNIWKKL